jgi:CheY-like chemotaxis protein
MRLQAFPCTIRDLLQICGSVRTKSRTLSINLRGDGTRYSYGCEAMVCTQTKSGREWPQRGAEMLDPLAARPKMRADDVLKIMAVDDEPRDLEKLRDFCARADHPKCRLSTFSSVESACEAVLNERPDVVLLDDCMEGTLMAEKAMARLREEGYSGSIAVLSSVKQPGRSQLLIRSGAFYHFDKNELDFVRFMELVDMAMATGRLLRFKREPPPERVARFG